MRQLVADARNAGLGALGADRQRDQETARARESFRPAHFAQHRPATSSADLPAMLLAAREYLKVNKSGRTEIWICSDFRENDWNSSGGRWQALRDGFHEMTQAVRFHLLAYPDIAPENLSIQVTDVRRRTSKDGAELLLSLKVTRQDGTNDVATVPVQIEIDGARSEVTLRSRGMPSSRTTRFRLKKAETGVGAACRFRPMRIQPTTTTGSSTKACARRTIIVADDPQAVRPLTLAASISSDPRSVHGRNCCPGPGGGNRLGQVSLLLWQAPLPEGDSAKQVRSFVERGGSVIFFPPRAPGGAEFFGVRWTSWTESKSAIPVVGWRSDEDLLAQTAGGAPLPVGGLEIRKYCGLSGEVTGLATLRDGPPLLARVPTDHGAVYFCATTPAPGDSSLATGGVVFYVLVQRACLRCGALWQHPAAHCGRGAAIRPDLMEAGSRGERGPVDRLSRFRAAFIRPASDCWPSTLAAEKPGAGRGRPEGRRTLSRARFRAGRRSGRQHRQPDPGDLAISGRHDGRDAGRGRLCLPKMAGREGAAA